MPFYRRNVLRRYSILKFNDTLKIDPGKWAAADYSIRMAREDNKEQAAANEIRQVSFLTFCCECKTVVLITVACNNRYYLEKHSPNARFSKEFQLKFQEEFGSYNEHMVFFFFSLTSRELFEISNSPFLQDYGEGSEYGKALREEARRKKYGRQLQTYQHDNQPWMLSITDSSTFFHFASPYASILYLVALSSYVHYNSSFSFILMFWYVININFSCSKK